MLPSTNDKVEPPLRTTRRGLTTEEVVIELGVYTDSSFTAQFPSTDVSKRLELMILKYNGVIYMRYQIGSQTYSHTKSKHTNRQTKHVSYVIILLCSIGANGVFSV